MSKSPNRWCWPAGPALRPGVVRHAMIEVNGPRLTEGGSGPRELAETLDALGFMPASLAGGRAWQRSWTNSISIRLARPTVSSYIDARCHECPTHRHQRDPPDVGGVSDYTRQVAEGLARMGDEVQVWCPLRPMKRASPGAHTPQSRPHRAGRLETARQSAAAVRDPTPTPGSMGASWLRLPLDEPVVLSVVGQTCVVGRRVELMVHEP